MLVRMCVCVCGRARVCMRVCVCVCVCIVCVCVYTIYKPRLEWLCAIESAACILTGFRELTSRVFLWSLSSSFLLLASLPVFVLPCISSTQVDSDDGDSIHRLDLRDASNK